MVGKVVIERALFPLFHHTDLWLLLLGDNSQPGVVEMDRRTRIRGQRFEVDALQGMHQTVASHAAVVMAVTMVMMTMIVRLMMVVVSMVIMGTVSLLWVIATASNVSMVAVCTIVIAAAATRLIGHR